MMAYYLDSKSITSLTMFIMAVVLTSYLFKSNDRLSAGRWLLSTFVIQVLFMAVSFMSMSTGFWGTVFYGPQFIIAMIYFTLMIQFAYHYPRNDRKSEAKWLLAVSLVVLLIVILLAAQHIRLFLQPAFPGSRILLVSNIMSLLMLLWCFVGIFTFLRLSIHRSKTHLLNERNISTVKLSSINLLLHPLSSEAIMLRNLSLAFLFTLLPAVSQPLINVGVVSAAAGFYLYSLGLLVQLLIIFISYINRSRKSISYVSKVVSFSMGIMLAILGGVAWKNADNFNHIIKNNIEEQISQAINYVVMENYEYLPTDVAYIVSWEEQNGQFSDYHTLFSRSETFDVTFIQVENRLLQSDTGHMLPYPESSEVDVIERLLSIDMDSSLRYDDNPLGSTPRYIGYQFDHDDNRYEIGFRKDDLLKTIHRNMQPMFYMVLASSLAIWILMPLVLNVLMVKPLNRLLAAIERYTLVDDTSLIPVQYEDEIGYLTHAFNDMLQTIKKSQAALQHINDELEERVAARTAELSQSNKLLKKEIVERKRVEKQLIVARDAAESAARTKSEFLAMMSHEIRTPLNAIIGMTSLLMSTSHGSEEAEYIETIRNSSDNLLDIINHVLDFSKIETGSIDLEEQSFELAACIEEVIDLAVARQPVENIDLVYNIMPDVPEFICGDISRLRQVLVNLVGNAVKFTEEGEVLVRVERKVGDETQAGHNGDLVEDEKMTLKFSISDTGIGISKGNLPRLFKPFSQADASTTRKYGGTGLGLAISSRLVHIMDGELTVSSEEGAGSTFSFTVRVKAGSGETADENDEAVQVLNAKSVLIVDDHESSRQMLADLCRRWQMEPLAVSSGELALQQLAYKKHFDVALIDLYMPEMGGVELAAKIRRSRHSGHVPLILLSPGHTSRSTAEQRVPHDYFLANLSKPIKASYLRKTLVNVLSNNNVLPEEISMAGPALDSNLADRLPLRILIAEDNPVNQRLAIRVFEKMGYQVDIVGNGLEVLQAVARQDYDLIFMDIQMPEMDGLEVTRKLLEKKPARRPCIIAMTANALDGDREKCLAAGMDDYISKPVRLGDIQAAIERWGRDRRD